MFSCVIHKKKLNPFKHEIKWFKNYGKYSHRG